MKMEKVFLPISDVLQVAPLSRNPTAPLNNHFGYGMCFIKLESTGIKLAKTVNMPDDM
jgi:hypothetical protein